MKKQIANEDQHKDTGDLFSKVRFQGTYSRLMSPRRTVSFNPFPLSNGHEDGSSFLLFTIETKSRKDLHTKNKVSCLALQLVRMG
jgi:hypothetical protein